VPSASNTISGYDTQYGAGITTKPPAESVAINALYKTCRSRRCRRRIGLVVK
jgi:hypothetical protein